MINIEYGQKAKQKLESGAWGYLVGGAENEIVLRKNSQDFQRFAFVPQSFEDVSQIDLSVKLLGLDLRLPIIAAPIGGLTQFHEGGDLEWARGCHAARIAGVVSGVARVEFEKIIKETQSALFYQLYFFGDDAWIKDRIQLAEQIGYKAIVVTVDTKYFGQRERDILVKYDARQAGWRSSPPPPDRSRNEKLTIKELEKIKKYTRLPFIVKGLVSADDVQQAIAIGSDAIWISNHGGRQLDYLDSALQSLIDLAPLCHKKKIPVIFDSGVRRGSEVLIAKLLGADCVALGRLPVYGLAVGGAQGMKEVIDNIENELKATMGLIGLTSFKDNPEKLSRKIRPVVAGVPVSTVWDKLEEFSL